MIPQKIQALLDFIDYLDKNKKDYIEKYVPLCDELKALHNQREKINPKSNYTDKKEYDKIQTQITEKFKPITQNIYNPITSKLRELGIWSGDDTYSSIWNNNVSVIYDFKDNFKSEDVSQIMESKHKYLCFRQETKTDFLCLIFAFHNLDDILKELFDFFKDTNENEFVSFETKKIEVNSISEALKRFSERPTENIKFTIPMQPSSNKTYEKEIITNTTNIKNEIIMGNKFQVGDIPNNSGQVTIGNENKTSVHKKDDVTQKSFNWQKTGIIIATVLAIATIALMIIFKN
jgi:hypothetical protein